ncbi:thiolase family protein [Aestuariivirga sp.]|uniref:thiolase family protein n=1 Tax=Aestuariivirga sp. TaxID=2650926 RepID=UPI00391B277E
MAEVKHEHDPVVVAAARRTPIGAFQGALSSLRAPQLGAMAIGGLVKGSIAADEVLMGNVLGAGIGQNPSRQAALGAGLGEAVPCTTISKVCGSGMKAVIQGHDSILAGSNRVVIAGGMESMSNAPYLLPKARGGLRLGHAELKDHMFTDGLEDAYEGRLMGYYADELAEAGQFSRAVQDDYALLSLSRAQEAIRAGAFADELVATGNLAQDEMPARARPEKIPQLRPAFRPDGTVTAANASSISDGAAALLLMRLSEAERRGIEPIAMIAGHAGAARPPREFTTAPVDAMRLLLQKTGWEAGDVDLYEINEAFAVVALHALRELRLPPEKVNVHGGACALGHPIGASGARIIVTLAHAMRRHGARRGIASLCIGGGEATAIALAAP